MQGLVKTSRRVWLIVSAVIAMGTMGYAAISAAVKTDTTEKRVTVLERHERATLGMIRKIDVKLDIALKNRGIEVPAHLRAPSDAEWDALMNRISEDGDEL